jgi:pimeloyl-ACP methyl ester carboxylesterase
MLILLIALKQYFVRLLTYPAPSVGVSSPPPGPFKEIRINYANGNSAIGWLFENTSKPKAPILLMFHGNGENLETMRRGGLLEQFKNLNAHFLAIDYPGYGRSSGKSSEENNIAAANAAFQWIAGNFEKNPKIVFGWSLGAATAIQTVFHNQNKTDGLIAISAWSSLPEVAAAHYPRFLVSALVKEYYNSAEAAKEIRCPVLLMHGERDNIIPFLQGKKVAEAMGENVRWVPVPNAGHNDIFGKEIVWKEITMFINSVSQNRTSP